MTRTTGAIRRLHPDLDALIAPDAAIEQIAGGFIFTEGPLWRPDGVLWFSDIVGNVVRQWSPGGQIVEILRPGGYDGHSLPAGGFNGPNGSTAGPDGSVLLCQHGNRRVARIDRHRTVSTVVDGQVSVLPPLEEVQLLPAGSGTALPPPPPGPLTAGTTRFAVPPKLDVCTRLSSSRPEVPFASPTLTTPKPSVYVPADVNFTAYDR